MLTCCAGRCKGLAGMDGHTGIGWNGGGSRGDYDVENAEAL